MPFSAIASKLLRCKPRRGGGVSSYFAGDMAAVEALAADIMRVTGITGRTAYMAAVEAAVDVLAASGAAATPGAIVLAGSGFGTKAAAAPLGFSTFDALADGTPASNAAIGLQSLDGFDPGGGVFPMPAVSSIRSHSGSRSLRYEYPTGPYNEDGVYPRIGIEGFSSLTIYYACWAYWRRSAGAARFHNFKLSRGGNGNSYSGNPRFYTTIFPNSSGVVPTGSDETDSGWLGTSGATNYGPADNVSRGFNSDGWHFLEWKWTLSNPTGTPTGKYQSLVDGVLNSNAVNIVNRTNAALNNWIMTIFDGMDSYGTANKYEIFMDEYLIDTTFQRVVATDSATYSASTKWAPQRCASWSDTEVTIDAPNWSDFASGSTVYFHVFNSSDVLVSSHARVRP